MTHLPSPLRSIIANYAAEFELMQIIADSFAQAPNRWDSELKLMMSNSSDLIDRLRKNPEKIIWDFYREDDPNPRLDWHVLPEGMSLRRVWDDLPGIHFFISMSITAKTVFLSGQDPNVLVCVIVGIFAFARIAPNCYMLFMMSADEHAKWYRNGCLYFGLDIGGSTLYVTDFLRHMLRTCGIWYATLRWKFAPIIPRIVSTVLCV